MLPFSKIETHLHIRQMNIIEINCIQPENVSCLKVIQLLLSMWYLWGEMGKFLVLPTDTPSPLYTWQERSFMLSLTYLTNLFVIMRQMRQLNIFPQWSILSPPWV